MKSNWHVTLLATAVLFLMGSVFKVITTGDVTTGFWLMGSSVAQIILFILMELKRDDYEDWES